MMRRIELLPESYQRKRKERRTIMAIIAGGVVVLLLLVAYWVVLQSQVSDQKDRLDEVQATNAQLQSQIADLQRFADLDEEVRTKETALATVMAGDVDWPAVFTEIAMVTPGEVWLTDLSASAGLTEGAEPVETETAPVKVSDEAPFGRMRFSGTSLTMPGIAKWLIRLSTVRDFDASWLNSATETQIGTTNVLEFQSTIEFNAKAASGRFLAGDQP